MKRIVDSCIVLGRINYGEADRIVTVLSKNNGKQTLMAKGVRKQKSKLAGGLEVFNVNELTFIPGKKDISSLVSSRLKLARSNIVKDYEVSQEVFGCLKWLNDHIESGFGAEYYDLADGLLMLADEHGLKAGLWFYMRALELSGHGLDPFHDASGAKLEQASSYVFDFDASCFAPKEDADYSQADIKLLRLALTLKPADFGRIATSQSQEKRLNNLIATVLRYTF